MPQAKFSLTEDQIQFVNQYAELGFPDKSALVREALEHLKVMLERERWTESAKLYAEVYREDEELRQLTETAMEDWPQ